MKNKKKIVSELLKKHYFQKNELKQIILKSIYHNQNTSYKKRMFAYTKLINSIKKSHISNQKQVCLLSGKYKSNWRFFTLARHTLKTLTFTNKIPNLKKKS